MMASPLKTFGQFMSSKGMFPAAWGAELQGCNNYDYSLNVHDSLLPAVHLNSGEDIGHAKPNQESYNPTDSLSSL
jgi:hypothetical protein